MHPEPYAWPAASDALALVPALSVAYYLLVRPYGFERRRVACFVVAQLLLLAVFATPLETLALNRLLTAHFLVRICLALGRKDVRERSERRLALDRE